MPTPAFPHIPEGVSDAQAMTVGDILSTGWTATKNAIAAVGQTLLVFGAGPVGLAAIHTARLYGVTRVIARGTRLPIGSTWQEDGRG